MVMNDRPLCESTAVLHYGVRRTSTRVSTRCPPRLAPCSFGQIPKRLPVEQAGVFDMLGAAMVPVFPASVGQSPMHGRRPDGPGALSCEGSARRSALPCQLRHRGLQR